MDGSNEVKLGKLDPNTSNGDAVEDDVYVKSSQYWAAQDADDNGMLGGLGHLSRIELQDSEKFLKSILKLPDAPKTERVIDCGAGIGRISKNLLQRFFTVTDLVDQDPAFIERAKDDLKDSDKIGQFFCSGLQKFVPTPQTYDVIWVQWVLNYLTDSDLVEFLNRCRKALKPDGVLILKENTTKGKSGDYDEEDSSVTRAINEFFDIFKKADFKLIQYTKQKNFPKELYPVWMFCIKPNKYE